MKKTSKAQTVITTVRLPLAMVDHLKKKAKRDGLSLSEVVRAQCTEVEDRCSYCRSPLLAKSTGTG